MENTTTASVAARMWSLASYALIGVVLGTASVEQRLAKGKQRKVFQLSITFHRPSLGWSL